MFLASTIFSVCDFGGEYFLSICRVLFEYFYLHCCTFEYFFRIVGVFLEYVFVCVFASTIFLVCVFGGDFSFSTFRVLFESIVGRRVYFEYFLNTL